MSSVKSIIKKYENHSSIINMNNKVAKSENRYNITLTTAGQIIKIIKKLNPNKATGLDKIPPKIVILSAKINTLSFSKYQQHSVRFTKRVIEIKCRIIDL